MKFKPNGSWVILPNPTKTQTESGIFLDEDTANKQATNILEALAVGPQCTFVKKGDTVMVDPRTEAVKAVIDKVEYLLVGEHQLLGKW